MTLRTIGATEMRRNESCVGQVVNNYFYMYILYILCNPYTYTRFIHHKKCNSNKIDFVQT